MRNEQGLTESDLRELEAETNPLTAGDLLMELERRGNERTEELRTDCLNLLDTLQQERNREMRETAMEENRDNLSTS